MWLQAVWVKPPPHPFKEEQKQTFSAENVTEASPVAMQ
jgi:hypothetical protein